MFTESAKSRARPTPETTSFTTAPRVADLATNVAQLKQPTLLISGDSDTVVPLADTKKLATMTPDASLLLVAGAAVVVGRQRGSL